MSEKLKRILITICTGLFLLVRARPFESAIVRLSLIDPCASTYYNLTHIYSYEYVLAAEKAPDVRTSKLVCFLSKLY